MKRKVTLLLTTALLCWQTLEGVAQQWDLAKLEAKCIESNCFLLAQTYAIKSAEALKIQEKVWHNPELSISEVNLWRTHQIDTQAPILGNWGYTQQIAVAIEQLIETAKKRTKRVAIKELEIKDAELAYEEALKLLKKALRMTYFQLYKTNIESNAVKEIVDLYEQLRQPYERQSQAQHLSKADYLRVNAEFLNLQNEWLALEQQKLSLLTNLRILTHQPTLAITDLLFQIDSIPRGYPSLANILNLAYEHNPHLLQQKNKVALAKKNYELERANRIPDLTLSMNYDRGGNMMTNFVGLGLSLPLPLYNKNKGSILAAQYQTDQAQQQYNHALIQLEQTIGQLLQELQAIQTALDTWDATQLVSHHDMLLNYKKHLASQQVSLIAFIDFTKAYKEAILAYWQLIEKYYQTYEELQFVVGTDLAK